MAKNNERSDPHAKLEVIKPPANVRFLDTIRNRRGISIYIQRITEALNQDSTIRISAKDYYMLNCLRKAAKSLQLKLLYALDGEFLYIKPMLIEGEMKRLLLLLREPRSMVELEGKKLELHLSNSLQALVKDGLAQCKLGKWVLTEKGNAQAY